MSWLESFLYVCTRSCDWSVVVGNKQCHTGTAMTGGRVTGNVELYVLTLVEWKGLR